MLDCACTGTGAWCIAPLLGGPPEVLNTGAGAARLGLLCADDAFWRAMLARVSKMLGIAVFAGAVAGLLPEPSDANRFGGGLPGGVVD